MPYFVEEFSFPSATEVAHIHAKLYMPQAPNAVVQLAHGMAEHMGRYHDFAAYLAHAGIAVALHDHAGHGKSMGEGYPGGYFGAQNGWSNLVADMKTLHGSVAARCNGLPYVLMGHSMGSFLTRTYASRHGGGIAAFILMGTAGKNPALGVGRAVAGLELARNGEKSPSTLLRTMSFGTYNKAFAPNRTNNDWLTRDHAVVDAYENDPQCGFAFTAEGMRDLFDGLTEISSKQWAAQVPHAPILLLSGSEDPVGGKGAGGVKQVYNWLISTGHTVTLRLYEGARHELLNEINRDEVYGDILRYIQSVI
ncbi:MAG: lysophospholipase [Clostridiales bacterium]|jgi:alpha-beta hydrolase superfamily lysophospholipase|nr:lysophospholipase [Clostridiales bacterium]